MKATQLLVGVWVSSRGFDTGRRVALGAQGPRDGRVGCGGLPERTRRAGSARHSSDRGCTGPVRLWGSVAAHCSCPPCLPSGALLVLNTCSTEAAFPCPRRQRFLCPFSPTCLPHRGLGKASGLPCGELSWGRMGPGCLCAFRPSGARRAWQEPLRGPAQRRRLSPP